MPALHVYSNRHIKNEIHNIKKNDTIRLEDNLSLFRWKDYFIVNNINEAELNVTYITKEEYNNLEGTIDNKEFPFDLVLSNSAYSSGDNLLYPPDFKKNLELAPTVIQVMPVDLESQQVRLKAHNNRVKQHMIEMSENVTDKFNVGIPDIRYITASKLVNNKVEKYIDPLDSHTILFPERKRLNPLRGTGAFNRKENCDDNGIDVMLTIYRGNKIQWRKIKTDIANKVKPDTITDAPYLVIVSETVSNGLFNTSIVKNDGTKWGSGIFAFTVSNKQEAIKLEKWLTSDTMKQEIIKLMKLKNVYSISGPMVKKLPWYE